MRITLYSHSRKESNYTAGVKAGLNSDQLDLFMFTGYEHEMVYEVSADGHGELVEVDGRVLRDKNV